MYAHPRPRRAAARSEFPSEVVTASAPSAVSAASWPEAC
jgi:hypothetical protein